MSDNNYMTPGGLQRLKSELEQLLGSERPKLVETITWAASNGDRSENADYIYGKRRLREIDKRIGYLTSRIERAVVVDPEAQKGDRVLFGATIELIDDQKRPHTYCIVGEDEIDLSLGKISWKAPLARACLGKTAGDEVVVQTPKGPQIYILEKVLYVKTPS